MHTIIPLGELDHSHVALAGGKAANLGELARISGIAVPPGFCVTTAAFTAHVVSAPAIAAAVDELARGTQGRAEVDAALCARIRSLIDEVPILDELSGAIAQCVAEAGEGAAWAVRSSANAEDMPAASFAGQHDSYLDLRGPAAVLAALRSCWASLFTDRAVAYRQRNGIDHRATRMAVIVQRMVPAEVSGVLFTADPVTGDRTVVAIEACAGTGEALAAGTVVPESVTLKDGRVAARTGASARCWTTNRHVRWPRSGGPSKPTSAARRTSNGAWRAAASRSCRAVRSPRYSPSRGGTTGSAISTCRSGTSR